MAINQHKPVRSETIANDREGLLNLKRLPDYAPVNRALTVESIESIEVRLRKAEEEEILAAKALEAARSARITAEWEFHNTMLGAKAVVVGQYGANSEAVQAIGLKKKSEYRRPVRRRSSTI